MCDWTYAAYAVLFAGTANTAETQRQSASENRTMQREQIAKAERDKAAAEAKAVQSANARLAVDQQRRRQQGNLLSRGGAANDESVLSSAPKSVADPAVSSRPLMSRGAGAQFFGT